MHNEDILNGLAAILTADEAYQNLHRNTMDVESFTVTAAQVLECICTQNQSLCTASCLCNTNTEDGIEIGSITAEVQTDMFVSLLQKQIPALMHQSAIALPVRVNLSQRFVVALETDHQLEDASVLVQYILLSSLQQNNDLHFYCADMVKGGSFFSVLNGIIPKFSEKTGGQVFKNDTGLNQMLDKLEKYADAALSSLGDTLSTVTKYNEMKKTKLPEFVQVLCLNDENCSLNLLKRLHQLVENREKNGMSFIIVGSNAVTSQFADMADVYLRYESGSITIGAKAALPFAVSPNVEISDEAVKQLDQSMQAASVVNTVYAERSELHTKPQTMYSENRIRVPFAIDKNGSPIYFELGGDAPPHALLSGGTGYGKSVALHSLIMQIVYNYHPDDVEIWAVDYKTVEFKQYIDHMPPHFRVIGLDTSTEFSLSLIDYAWEEYETRLQKCQELNVKDIEGYRKIKGPYSMPRIIIFMDEFQLLTQAVENAFSSEYRTKLENLLRLTRAMGMSFVFCSQTVSTGLNGLTQAGKDQIQCRLSLNHQSNDEIRETLAISGQDAGEAVERVKNLQKGQAIYKRIRLKEELKSDGKSYELLQSYILYIDDTMKRQMIDAVWETVGDQYQPKDVVIANANDVLSLPQKVRHPIQQFVQAGTQHECEDLLWYPAAPTTLKDYYEKILDNAGGANVLMVGESNDLRESVTVHSVCGFLMQEDVRVVVSVVDEHNADRERLLRCLQQIRSDRLTFSIGVANVLTEISKLKKIRPLQHGHVVYLWYGLDKLKNEIFLMRQDMEEAEEQQNVSVEPSSDDGEALLADLLGTLAAVTANQNSEQPRKIEAEGLDLSFEDCCSILQQAFDMGPENGQCHFVLYNNRKVMKKSGVIVLSCFENRIGTTMSGEDSFELFDSTSAVQQANERTVIYYTGSGKPTPLRPYKMPEASWFEAYNARIAKIEGR